MRFVFLVTLLALAACCQVADAGPFQRLFGHCRGNGCSSGNTVAWPVMTTNTYQPPAAYYPAQAGIQDGGCTNGTCSRR